MRNKIMSVAAALLIGITSVCVAQETEKGTKIAEISKREFRQTIWNPNKSKKFVYEGSKVIVLEFGATWCKPCKLTAPKLEELQAEYGDRVTFYSIDIDKDAQGAPSYPDVFNFENIPVLMVIKPGMKKKPVAYRIGGKSKEEIRELIDALIAAK